MTATPQIDNPYRPPQVTSTVASDGVTPFLSGLSVNQDFYGWRILLGVSGAVATCFIIAAFHCSSEFLLGRRPPGTWLDGVVCALLIACAASSSTLVVSIYQKRSALCIFAFVSCAGAFCCFILTIVFN